MLGPAGEHNWRAGGCGGGGQERGEGRGRREGKTEGGRGGKSRGEGRGEEGDSHQSQQAAPEQGGRRNVQRGQQPHPAAGSGAQEALAAPGPLGCSPDFLFRPLPRSAGLGRWAAGPLRALLLGTAFLNA